MAVDPSSTCGDDPSSSTANYTIETSTNGTTWDAAAAGTFTSAQNGTLVPIPTSAPGVQFIRFTIDSNQVPNFNTTCAGGGGPSGCHFTDMSELQVFGVPSP
jgi:hypothetical protein